MNDPYAMFCPGLIVSNPREPEWGHGQIQSNIAGKATVNFPDQGKVVLDLRYVELVVVSFE